MFLVNLAFADLCVTGFVDPFSIIGSCHRIHCVCSEAFSFPLMQFVFQGGVGGVSIPSCFRLLVSVSHIRIFFICVQHSQSLPKHKHL